jgi:hypothetical protein
MKSPSRKAGAFVLGQAPAWNREAQSSAFTTVQIFELIDSTKLGMRRHTLAHPGSARTVKDLLEEFQTDGERRTA